MARHRRKPRGQDPFLVKDAICEPMRGRMGSLKLMGAKTSVSRNFTTDRGIIHSHHLDYLKVGSEPFPIEPELVALLTDQPHVAAPVCASSIVDR